MFIAINSDRHKLINYTRGGNWNKLYRGSLLHAHGGTVMAQLNDVLRVSWQRLGTAALAAVVLSTLAQELAHNSRQVVVLDEICREKQCKQHFCRRLSHKSQTEQYILLWMGMFLLLGTMQYMQYTLHGKKMVVQIRKLKINNYSTKNINNINNLPQKRATKKLKCEFCRH